MTSVRYSHQIISTMLEEVLEKCYNEVHTDKIIQNDSNSPENVSSEVCHIMNELLDSLDDVDENAKNISTEPSKKRETTQDQQSGLTGVMNLSVDEENAKEVYEVMDFLLSKCCEIADKNHTSDYIFRENLTNVSKFLQGNGNTNYGAYLNDNTWNYVSSPGVIKENLTDDKIREKNMSENWDFKNKTLNQEVTHIKENHAVENMLVNHDSGEKLRFEQGLNEVDAGTRDVCFNVSDDVNLVPHNLPSLRCLCEQVLLGPTADSQGIESLKSLALKFIEGHGMSHCYETENLKIDPSPLKMKDNICLLKNHFHEERSLNCKPNENVSSEIPIIENPSKCESTSPKMVQGNEGYDFELVSKDSERNDCDGKMKFINYLGLSPSLALENETDAENSCSNAEQNAHESLLQPAVIESKSKNYTLNCPEMKQTNMREKDKVFELDLADSQCMSFKTETKDIKSIKLSETQKVSDDMKQGSLLIKTDVRNDLPLDMEPLIPCKRIKLEDEELRTFQNHHTDEKQCEIQLLAKMRSDDSKEDSNENMLDATVDIDMKKEKQNIDDTAMKNTEIIDDNLSVGQLESLVPLNFYQENQLKEEFEEEEKRVSEWDENHGNANLNKVLVSNNIPVFRAKDEDKCTISKEEGYVFEEEQKAVKSTEQMVPSTMNKEHKETYDGESFYDDENHRCDKYRNLGAKETVLHDEQKDSVHGVFEPNTKCFKWKYTPSYDDDMDAVVPDTEKESHDLPCRILPISSFKKPIRLGLSRKQHHLTSLHPYMKKEKK